MPKSYQIALSDAEKTRLSNHIDYFWSDAKASHQRRSERFAGYLKRWEARVSPPKVGDESKPNHPVPLTRWNTFNKLARDMQSLIGDQAKITAAPTGPSDADKARKVGAYMTSRVFNQMNMVVPLCVFEFRRILYGRAHAYRPWYRREFNTIEKGQRKRVCDYEGPGFFPIEPDDIVIPGERGVDSIQDFSTVARRVAVTVDDLQYGDGTLYQGTSEREFVQAAIRCAQRGGTKGTRSDMASEPIRDEQERSKGVDFDGMHGVGRGQRILWMWEVYTSWRPLKKRKRDGELDDLEARLPYEADWVVRYLPDMPPEMRIVGVQDLLELYPKMRRRRPLVDSSLIKDGTYWSMGFGQMLEDIETEATANSRLFTAAGELSVWPIVFSKPGSGMEGKDTRMEPGMNYNTEDPAGVRVIELRPNLEYCLMKNQETLSNGERTTGITDQSLGRASDRPNAPRTATGQLALIEEGNVRAWLDATVLREDIEQIIQDIWALDCDLAPKSEPGLWFRVTESQARGTAGFDTAKGGAYMTPEEFGGTYDFKLKLAVSAYSREAQAQKILSFYQLAMQNPIVMQNPRAMWVMLNRLAEALGIEDFSNIIPEPPDLDLPKTPDQEWTMMLEGEEVQPNPQDHDDLHLMAHLKQLADLRNEPNPDVQARNFLIHHIQETRQQKASKMAMQALTNELIRSIQPAPGEGGMDLSSLMGGGQPAPGGMPGSGAPQTDMPFPSSQVGSSAAPVAHEGQL